MKRSAAKPPDYKKGNRIAAFGIFMLSWDATLVRLADVSAWQAAFWRGAFIATALLLYLVVTRDWQQFHRMKHHSWVAATVCAVYGLNTFLFIVSISYTKVANTVVILSSTPLFSAFFSWMLLKERIALRTWWAMALAIVGVAVVFSSSITLAASFGDFVALVLAASTGFLFSFLRRYPDFPRLPAIAVGAAISAVCLLPFTQPLAMSAASLGWLALMGLFQKPIASACMMVATRYLPSPEVSLFFLLEAVLAPLWAWMIVGETPAPLAVVGGALVLVTLGVHSWLEIAEQNRS